MGKHSALRSLVSGRMIVCALMGFASGLPLLLTLSTMQAWMKESHVDLSVIGLMSLVGLPYTVKFLWAPFFDRVKLPFWGRRRSWLLVTQIFLTASIVGMGFSRPGLHPWLFAGAAFWITFFSASQDILIDSYRRESLSDEELGLGSSMYVNGYRVGMLVSGAGALFLADHISWLRTYLFMAAVMGVGLATTWLAPEPRVRELPPRTLREAFIEPLAEYFRRDQALWILLFIVLYKLGESLASAMTMPMYLELGFTKTEVGQIVKVMGLIATLAGGTLGGLWMVRLGIRRALVLFGVLQGVAILSFSLLAHLGHSLSGLSFAIFSENFSAGMATTAYAAFLASLTNKKFTATQYALFTSFMGVPRVLASAPSGYLAKALGWPGYFVMCTLVALPALWVLGRFKVGEVKTVKSY